MKKMLAYITGILATLLIVSGPVEARAGKRTLSLRLGESIVAINIYEKEGRGITFIAPHFNERAGTELARQAVERDGGRLIEVESRDASGRPARNLSFTIAGQNYSIDPNRIFTENGRACAGLSPNAAQAAAAFAEAVLKLALADDGRSLRQGERFLVAVHNNADVDLRDQATRRNDLTAVAFVKHNEMEKGLHGVFESQADGVFLSNTESDADNFVFVSTPVLISHFAERGFNVVLQKSAARLNSRLCTVDDGSLSVLAARLNIPYINLEADAGSGSLRQKQMIDAVYALAPAPKPEVVAAR